MKLAFLDTETTGLKPPDDYGLVDLAIIIEIDGEVKEKISIQCAPSPNDIITQHALDTQEVTEAELRSRQSPKEAEHKLISILEKYIDRYDKTDKLTIIGYNVQFDVDFLESFFNKNNNKFFGSWFNRRPLDVMGLAYYYRFKTGDELDDWKLETVCNFFGISISKAHSALPDAEATRSLFHTLDSILS